MFIRVGVNLMEKRKQVEGCLESLIVVVKSTGDVRELEKLKRVLDSTSEMSLINIILDVTRPGMRCLNF